MFTKEFSIRCNVIILLYSGFVKTEHIYKIDWESLFSFCDKVVCIKVGLSVP